MQKIEFKNSNSDKLNDFLATALIKIKQDKDCLDFIDHYEFDDQEIKDNASKFLKFIKSKEICSACVNKNKCTSEIKNFTYTLSYDNGINLEITPCHLTKNKFNLSQYYTYQDHDDTWLNYSLKDLASPDYIASRNIALKQFASLIKTEESKGTYLYGSHLTGKSFMSAVFAKVFADYKKQTVAFINCGERIKEINDLNFNSKDEFNRRLNELINADLLVLDGFGDEYKNEFIRDSIIFPLLLERLKNHRTTCFTSSYSLDEIKQMYGLKDNFSPKSRELVDIIKSLAKEIEIKSLPYRE